MYQVTITNIQDGRQWRATFSTMEELNTWLDKQKLKEGRKPERTVQDENGADVLLPAESTYEIKNLLEDAEYVTNTAIQNRKREYPSAEEFMNVFFDKGLNSPEMDALRAKRTQIKTKYPK